MKPQSVASSPVGRNDPCPCGSGRKFKQCCYQASGSNPGRTLQEARAADRAGRPDLAIRILQDGLAPDAGPVSLAIVNALAHALVAQGRAVDAMPKLERALQHIPGDVETICSQGLALAAMGRSAEAVARFERAAALSPGNAAVLNNLGNALRESGRIHESLQVFRRASSLQPALSVLHANTAATLLMLGHVDEALTRYASHLADHPRDAAVYSDLLFAMNYSDALTPEQIATAHRRFSEQVEKPLRPLRRPHPNAPDPGRRLRVGYVSGDLRGHSVAYFVESVLEHHDRSSFDAVAYYNQTQVDAVTERLKAHCARWRVIANQSDDAAEQCIRDDGIDILVDLSGHTGSDRLPLFARKPAPVQVTWLGYPNTTGLDAMDYRLTDAVADPPGASEGRHTEALWRLPGCFLCYRPPAWIDAAAAPVPATSITFGSFNNSSKIRPGVVAAWARILAGVPGSTLLLKMRAFEDPLAREDLRTRFAHQGIAPHRLLLVGKVADEAGHLARYAGVDIALDTFPYAGTTTTCDSLWMGVPVVTLAGVTHAGRVGASLMNAAGLGELVANSIDEYVNLAIDLATNPRRLQAQRKGLRERVAASPLTDGARFTRDFEAALREIWMRWCDSSATP